MFVWAPSSLFDCRSSLALGRSAEGSPRNVAVPSMRRVPTLSGAVAGSAVEARWEQMAWGVLAAKARRREVGSSRGGRSPPAISDTPLLRPAPLAASQPALPLAGPAVAEAQSRAALSWLALDRAVLELETAALREAASAGCVVEERTREKTGAERA